MLCSVGEDRYQAVPCQSSMYLEQRCGFQNIILIFYFYKKIRKINICILYKNSFQDKSIHIIFTFTNSTI